MTHEPECIWYDSPHECRLCEAIRAAYQRGREDAAKAVECVHHLPNSSLIWVGPAIAAARGDGERA